LNFLRRKIMKKAMLLFSLAVSALALVAAEPSVSGVLVRQNWPWNGNVDILYTLSADEPCDIEVTATWKGQAEPVALGGISGDCTKVSAGNRHIVWDPVAAGGQLPLTDFKVTVMPATLEARKYLILNLYNGKVTYSATEPDWKSRQAEFLATNMVFRRISVGTFNIGYPSTVKIVDKRSSSRQVTLSSDYYIAIFPTTTAQEKFINGSIPSETDMLTPTRTDGDTIRGDREEDNICWPETFHRVSENSLIGKMRRIFDKSLPASWRIDLPTAAQWENAARAGTDADMLCHLEGTQYGVAEGALIEILQKGALWVNGGAASPYNVGRFNPNQFGLYDTIGCIMEVVLDWQRHPDQARPLSPITDPTGMATADILESFHQRQVRGGRNNSSVKYHELLPGNASKGQTEEYSVGHRLCIHLKPITQIAD
jgi:formylglycine-generating enzyme required for sulfatase activity